MRVAQMQPLPTCAARADKSVLPQRLLQQPRLRISPRLIAVTQPQTVMCQPASPISTLLRGALPDGSPGQLSRDRDAIKKAGVTAGLLAGGSIDRDALLSRGVSFGSAHALTVLPSFSGEITGSCSCCR